MLLVRCPWCGERDETEFSYGGQAEIAYPPTRRRHRRGMVDVPLRPRQPQGPLQGALGAHARLPALVRNRSGTPWRRDQVEVPFRGCPSTRGARETRLPRRSSGTGCSVASVRSTATVHAASTPPARRSRTRSCRSARKPLLRATLVSLEEGLVAEPLSGKGRLLDAVLRHATTRCTRTAIY